ncbi:MAG: ATP-dependent helicase [Gammaproteobacteria bacterium]|nr:ATP-dependent helicase [Gammaproteobacteria bacterium]
MPIDLDTLNENQRKAVLWEDGPMLVLAGPGSGKTRVLSMRVVRLLEEREEVSVLALTFTTETAVKMRERVDHLLGQQVERTRLCTFYSFATDMLRQHGSHLGLRSDFSLLTQDEDRIAILDEVAKALENDGYPIPADRRNLLTFLDRLFADCYNGGPDAPANTPEWAPRLFKDYGDALAAANQLDFGSLLIFARRLLREKPYIARVLHLSWTHVCVDEFQDTNKAQYDLLRLLVADKQPNLFVVANDDQAVYQWNGASPEQLQALRSDYDMELVQLPENYRCPLEIIALANKLIVHNQMRIQDKKPLETSRTASLDNSVIRYGAFDTLADETVSVAQDILNRKLAPNDCVVLARSRKLLESAAEALRKAGLHAYSAARRKNDFETPVVRVVLNALRLANAPHDRYVLRRLCVAWQALSDVALEVEDVAASAALAGGDFLRAWVDAAAFGAKEKAALLDLLEKLRAALVDRLDFPGIVDWFFSEDIKPWSDDERALMDEMKTWREIHADIVREHGDVTLNVYLQQMDLAPKTVRPSANAVRCLTVHGAKGLEFKHVYLIGMAQEIFPSFHALKKGPDSRELEEERRICFVAITRVQDTLTLTRARQYNDRSKNPSQFLAEMGFLPIG